MAESVETPSHTLAFAAPTFTTPSNFTFIRLPTPQPSLPTSLLIRVRATSINPGELKRARGLLRTFESHKPPIVLGLDFSGTVIACYSPSPSPSSPSSHSSEATPYLPGDHVFGIITAGGSASEYVIADTSTLSRKPDNVSFDSAAAVGIAGLSALLAIERALQLLPSSSSASDSNNNNGSLRGKTVFVNAGLGGIGSIACHLVKNVFGAAKVITTVSTAKVSLVSELLGDGVVDQLVDYKTENVVQKIGKQAVDVFIDTQGEAVKYVEVMKPDVGVVVSLAMIPGSAELKVMYESGIPWWLGVATDVVDWWTRWRMRRWGVERYECVLMHGRESSKDLEKLAKWMEDGKVKVVIGHAVQLRENELDRLRAAYEVVASGNGGVGKTIVYVGDGE